MNTNITCRSIVAALLLGLVACASASAALTLGPADTNLLRIPDRLHGLEGELNSLRSLATRHRAEVASARESLQNVRTERYTSLLLATCFSLLAGGGVALLWHRSRRTGARVPYASWFPPGQPPEDLLVEEEEVGSATASPSPIVASPAPVPPHSAVAPRQTEPLVPLFAPPKLTHAEPVFTAPVALHAPHGTTGLTVDALQSAQQQGEFFASLGQVDEAIAVLSDYIRDCSEKPVPAFLELFRLYHALGMRVEYEELQSQFRQTFGVDVASFGQYRDEVRELETYLVAVGRIAAAWPSTASQEVIEDLLFKAPSSPRDLMSVYAYRDLLWLYSLGQSLLDSTGVPAGLQLMGGRGLPNDHFILPWASSQDEGPTELSLERLSAIDVASGLDGFALDVDLTAAPGGVLEQSRPQQVGDAKPASKKLVESSEEPVDAFDRAMETASRKNFR